MSSFSTQTLLSAVTSTTTSSSFEIGEADKISLQFIASAISAGNGVFTVDVSNDGDNWIAYNRMNSNVTDTNAQTDTRVASVTLSSNTNAIVTFPIGDAFRFIRVKATVTTDGAYSAKLFLSR